MANSLTGATRKLLDGKLTLYLRPNSSYWWASYYRGRTHMRFSTQSVVLEVAEQRARNWYYQQQLQTPAIAAPHTALTFHAAVDLAIAQYQQDAEQGRRSAVYVITMARLLRRLTALLPDMPIEQVNQRTWNELKRTLLTRSPKLAPATLHKYHMGLRIVLNEAARRSQLQSVPRFVTDLSMRAKPTARTWFTPAEYQRLLVLLRDNVERTGNRNPRKHAIAQELLDYVEFVVASGLRLGEAHNVRFCDVSLIADTASDQQPTCLLIRNIKGKRGRDGSCKTHWDAVAPFLRTVNRRGVGANWSASETTLFEKPHAWQFVQALVRAGLRYTQHRPPRKRDLMSLRHTYICFRLLEQVPVFNIAINCRTSVAMIERHYARYLNVESAQVNGAVSIRQSLADDEA